MSDQGRFRYRLQPLLLTRQWALDALKQDLAAANARCAEQLRQYERLTRMLAEANGGWNEAVERGMALDGFVQSMRYLHDLAAQCSARQRQLSQAEEERDALIKQAAEARRALDGVERHRDDMRAAFDKAAASARCKQSDDLWLMLEGRKETHEHEL
jgi:hypothetical protein